MIVEYNPFHNGHKYHADKTRELSNADVVIAVMSGNFLQRGEPAIVDKWLRAKEALQNGVDLVIELPIQWSLQSADYFARGGIALLQQLECESYCFGTDTSDAFDYQAFGEFVAQNQEKINQTFQGLQNPAMTYAQKMTEVFRQLYPQLNLTASQPNHILALSYAQENAQFVKPMKSLALQRLGADYHSTAIKETIASATAIRQAIIRGENISTVVPTQTNIDLQTYQISWENYWPLLKYQIISSTIEELQAIYQMVEGLEYRLKQFVYEVDTFVEFVEKVKTKRYTRTRIQRLLCYVLLNIQTQDIQVAWQKNMLHVLGFNERGQQYLKEKKSEFEFPLVSKIGKLEEQNYPLTIRADRIYQLGNPLISEQNFGKTPIRVKSK